jgi:hypothetical protein
MSGGTYVTLYGQLLDTGREMSVSIGGKACKVYNFKDGTINKYVYSALYNLASFFIFKDRAKL